MVCGPLSILLCVLLLGSCIVYVALFVHTEYNGARQASIQEQKQEDEMKEILKSFRYTMLVNQAVAKRHGDIRAKVMANYEEDVRKEVEKRIQKTKRKTVVERKKTLDDDHAHWLIRRTRQKERLERRERLARREDGEDGATRQQPRQKRREMARLKRHRLSTDESARPAIGDRIPILLSADEWDMHA